MNTRNQRGEQLEVHLLATGRAVRRVYNERLAALGVTMTESGLLQFIHREGALSQSELARRLHIGRMAAGSVVDDLAKRGLVRKERNRRDRRIWQISATDTGTTMALACIEVNDEVIRTLRYGLSRAEVAALFASLERLRSNAELTSRKC